MKHLAIYGFLLLSGFIHGQVLDARISQDKIVIGQPVTLTYSVKTKAGDSIVFQPQQNSIQARMVSENGTLSTDGIEFEILDDCEQTYSYKDKTTHWIGQYVVTAWDSGLFLLPGPDILINDSTFHFKDISVACYLSDPIKGVDLYDIKENYADVPPNPFSLGAFLKEHWWWISLIVVAIVAFFVIRRIIRKRREAEDEEDERPISLRDRTIIAIEALEKAKLWEKDRLKEHFVELSYILRSYLTSRYDISLLEKTTYETTLILTQKGLEKETVDVIVRILSQSDMVKFAKSNPDVVAILRVSTEAKQVVAETSPLEFDNVD